MEKLKKENSKRLIKRLNKSSNKIELIQIGSVLFDRGYKAFVKPITEYWRFKMLLTWKEDQLICEHKIVHADFKTKLAIIKKKTTFGLTHWIVFHNSTMHKGFDNPKEAKTLFNKLVSRFNSTLTVFSIL